MTDMLKIANYAALARAYLKTRLALEAFLKGHDDAIKMQGCPCWEAKE